MVADVVPAEVTTTTSSRNTALVKSLGADGVIDYKPTRFEDLAREIGALVEQGVLKPVVDKTFPLED
ncbi:hypothetical protein LZ199_15960 [Myxococcus sp. QH3KD-4-1]|nr:hypothetical protein [Myxococcus qinghaiensis]